MLDHGHLANYSLQQQQQLIAEHHANTLPVSHEHWGLPPNQLANTNEKYSYQQHQSLPPSLVPANRRHYYHRPFLMTASPPLNYQPQAANIPGSSVESNTSLEVKHSSPGSSDRSESSSLQMDRPHHPGDTFKFFISSTMLALLQCCRSRSDLFWSCWDGQIL
jgi:hypothetical protein